MPKFPKPFLILLGALALAALACGAASQAGSPPENLPADAPGASELSGEQVFQQMGCDQCHNSIVAVAAAGAAPSLAGVYGSQVELEGGEAVVADEAYLRESILSPGAKIVAGYQPIMPAEFSSQLSDAEIEALVEYIKQLRD